MQDYAWVKRGMIYPFVDYVDRCVVVINLMPLLLLATCICLVTPWAEALFCMTRFQEQSELNHYKPSDFQMAIEEAFLAERGFTEKLLKDINLAVGNPTYDESVLRGVKGATGSNQGTECHVMNQVSYGVSYLTSKKIKIK